MLRPEILASYLFPEAAAKWLLTHERHIKAGTVRHYRMCISSLTKFFSAMRLNQIHIGHLEQYQIMRSSGNWLSKAGPSVVNHELNTLSQILARAGLWTDLSPHYKPLPLPQPTVGCALAPEDEERLFRIAAQNPRWKLAYWCSLLTANTTAGPAEIRFLRLRDVDMLAPSINIQEGVKNEYRKRLIPLNENAAWALRKLVERAHECGAHLPDHYLLPHRAANGQKGFDPTRPLYSWRTSWEKLRNAAGMPHLRMYDLRHHVITKLLEDEDVSERTVIELAGHVSRQMLDRYSHIRMKTKRSAVDALVKKTVQPARAALMLVKK